MPRYYNWCFTLNNPKPGETKALESSGVKYLVYGREHGDSKKTEHYQGYIEFKLKRSMRQLKKLLPRAHWEPRRGTAEEASSYCKKDDDYVEVGKISTERYREGSIKGSIKGGQMMKATWDAAYAAAKRHDLEAIPAWLRIRHYLTFQRITKDHPRNLQQLDALDNYWYVGASGTGKSRYARKVAPDAFIKNCNKWWDGYRDEDDVIIDDVEKEHTFMGHFLKIWADHYPFCAEIKGSAMLIRPKRIIVTSNYSPDQIWSDPHLLEALDRRFKVLNFPCD